MLKIETWPSWQKKGFEFVKSSEYPDRIGIRKIGIKRTAWYGPKLLRKQIDKLEEDLDFYREVLSYLE